MIRRRAGVLALLLLVVLAPLETLAAAPTDGCCATCIGKPSAKPYSYDPLVYAQCSSAGGVCCFNCDSEKSSPTIENADFGDDGITPQVKVGEWVQVSWPNIARVTYESYKVNQTKTTTVTNGSAEATLDSGVFFICARSAGSISMRGWGKDSCTSVTPESTIVVLPGTSNGTCASRTPVAPTATTATPSGGSKAAAATVSADPMIAQCNLQRASIVTVDGKQTCVCAAEWTGAPDCAGFPWWKTAATIGGGIAAVVRPSLSLTHSEESGTDVDGIRCFL
jgi:hypothetical protein